MLQHSGISLFAVCNARATACGRESLPSFLVPSGANQFQLFHWDNKKVFAKGCVRYASAKQGGIFYFLLQRSLLE